MSTMTTADIIRLPGVYPVMVALIENAGSAVHPSGVKEWVYTDERYVNDLILAVAEAVEKKERARCARICDTSEDPYQARKLILEGK